MASSAKNRRYFDWGFSVANLDESGETNEVLVNGEDEFVVRARLSREAQKQNKSIGPQTMSSAMRGYRACFRRRTRVYDITESYDD